MSKKMVTQKWKKISKMKTGQIIVKPKISIAQNKPTNKEKKANNKLYAETKHHLP